MGPATGTPGKESLIIVDWLGFISGVKAVANTKQAIKA
jgi:hypothetical protein